MTDYSNVTDEAILATREVALTHLGDEELIATSRARFATAAKLRLHVAHMIQTFEPEKCKPRVEQVKESTMTEDQIKHMTERFLQWKLPTDFSPDDGISFDRVCNMGTASQYYREPTGTNLLNYSQAKAMVQFMLGAEEKPPVDPNVEFVQPLRI